MNESNDPVPETTPAYHEDDLSQVPALLLLQNLGYEYLTPAEAMKLRGGRESQVLLADVLADQLRTLNHGLVVAEACPKGSKRCRTGCKFFLANNDS